MVTYNSICVFTDGGSRGNPGPGAIGVVICDGHDNLLYEYSECIGHCTNNQAEYKGIIKALDLCAKYTRRKITVYSDSELVVNQMNGVYRLINSRLRQLFLTVKDKERVFDEIIYQHVRRSNNQRIRRADELVQRAQSGRPTDNCIIGP